MVRIAKPHHWAKWLVHSLVFIKEGLGEQFGYIWLGFGISDIEIYFIQIPSFLPTPSQLKFVHILVGR